jgi:hypothetical protein
MVDHFDLYSKSNTISGLIFHCQVYRLLQDHFLSHFLLVLAIGDDRNVICLNAPRAPQGVAQVEIHSQVAS